MWIGRIRYRSGLGSNGKINDVGSSLRWIVIVTEAVPALATSAALIVASTTLLEITEVSRVDPFQLTTASDANPVPWIVKVNPLLPGAALVGTRG
jgi:hypothetical protein